MSRQETIGDLLQQLRLDKGLSLSQLARRAGIAHSTIGSWERGLYQPRLPELEAVLAALEVSRAQRKRALSLIDAPRAILRARSEAEIQREQFVADVGQAPCGGDLLRAMRLRRGLTLQEAAHGIGVHAGTLSRCERSEMWPDNERLHALCFLLRAQAEEVMALTCGRFRLPMALEESASPQQWDQVITSVYRGPDSLRDLRFLSLETQLWHLSARKSFALPLLQRTYSYRARALMERNRFSEVEAYAARALYLAEQGHAEQEEWAAAIIACASVEYHRGRCPNPQRAARTLKPWLDQVRNPSQIAWMQCEYAIYLAQAGQTEAAIALCEDAIRFSEQNNPILETQFRWRDLARMLALSGRYGEALNALDIASPIVAQDKEALVRHRLLEAECLRGVGRTAEAQNSFREAMQTIAAHSLDYLQPLADALAMQLH